MKTFAFNLLYLIGWILTALVFGPIYLLIISYDKIKAKGKC